MIPDKRVAEVISRLTGVPVDQLNRGLPPNLPLVGARDSLDTIELLMELEEEFGEETVQWATRYIEALSARNAGRSTPSGPDAPDPLWDRDLDG